MKKFFLLVLFLILVLASCQKEDPRFNQDQAEKLATAIISQIQYAAPAYPHQWDNETVPGKESGYAILNGVYFEHDFSHTNINHTEYGYEKTEIQFFDFCMQDCENNKLPILSGNAFLDGQFTWIYTKVVDFRGNYAQPYDPPPPDGFFALSGSVELGGWYSGNVDFDLILMGSQQTGTLVIDGVTWEI